jgi:hypothetical protein
MRLGAGLLVGAGALGVTALLVREPSTQPITFVQPAVIESPPSTVATLPPPTLPSAGPEATATGDHMPSTSAAAGGAPLEPAPPSPLAAQLPQRVSALPGVAPVVAPVELWIGDITLWAPVVPVGFQPDGELQIPDETHVGWYRYGSSPGAAGSTVLAAHVSWNHTIGPFFKLGQLEPGALVKVKLADGTIRRYQVVERAQYGKHELPLDRIWTREGAETLVLMTCGGDFNRQIRHYTDNIVIYAVPIGESGTVDQ